MASCTICTGEGTTQDKEAVTILIDDIWFSLVRVAIATLQWNIEAIYQIESNHSLYLKQFIKDTLKEAPGGTCIILEGKHLDSLELVAISYRYNSKVTLYFMITKNAGSIRIGNLCKIKFTDLYGNVYIRLINCLSIISDFFKISNCIDKHN